MATLPRGNWFQPGDGIAREVITADIQRYLGPDALVRPGKGVAEYEGVDGYWITAYRTLTSQMVQDLKLDSQRWRQEVQQGRVAYQDSRTHQSRQYYGPSGAHAHATDAYGQQPVAQPQYAQAAPRAAYGEYTHTQPATQYAQANPYVPAPSYGQGQVRTAPTYAYAQPGASDGRSHYASAHQEDPRYAYPTTATGSRSDAYAAPQQAPSQAQYYTTDPRATYPSHQSHSSDRERRRR